MHHPGEQVYALRLRADASASPVALAGEIEHVLSGERRVFADGRQLIEQLQQLQGLLPATPASAAGERLRR